MPNITQEQLDTQLAAARADAERLATERLTAQFSAQGADLAELRATRQREVIAGQINTWKAKGLITPAEEAGLSEFMTAIDNATEFTFSAAGADAKKTTSSWFADFMAARKPVIKLGRQTPDATDDVLDGTDSDAILKAAMDFKAKEETAGRIVTIEFAVQHVTDKQHG